VPQDEALGEQQGQEGQALFSLRAVHPQLTPVAQDRKLVAMGPMARETALEVAVQALLQLRDELLLVLGTSAWPVFDARLAVAAKLAGTFGERLDQKLERLTTVLTQSERLAGQLTVPGGQRGPQGLLEGARTAQRVAHGHTLRALLAGLAVHLGP
jgi:hypothetical protein